MPQVTKIKRIVIASVLKPVDETRMYEKFGVLLAETGSFYVKIIGHPGNTKNRINGIEFLPLYTTPYKRLSIKRFLAPLIFLKKVFAVKPNQIIICTHELLISALLCKMMLGSKVYYDIQENYFRNILYGNSLPYGIKHIVAVGVRVKELLATSFITNFFLAESAYADEISFAAKGAILQNKLKSTSGKYAKSEYHGYSRFLFSGTLAQSTGVFAAIDLVRNLHNLDNTIQLTIIGHCPRSSEYHSLLKVTEKHTFITFLGNQHPVAHEQILNEIHQADFGIIIYPDSPSTQGSIPTKLYEYLALRLPVLIKHNSASHQLVQDYHAGIVLKDNQDNQSLLELLKSYRSVPDQSNLWWEDEFESVLTLLSQD